MSRSALVESLRTKAAEDVEAVWRDARAAADRYRLELAGELERQRAERLQASALAARLEDEAATAEAGRRARAIVAQASIGFADRLHGIALTELALLRNEDPDLLFEALAAGLPDLGWQVVRVNPADLARARQRFPRADVLCDGGISGGLEVDAEAGRIRVSNTLEARLATAWPDLLPRLIETILKEASAHRPAA